MDTSPPISSENSLLAEKSFINGQKSYFGNGHALEWTENMGNGVSSHNGMHNKVCVSDFKLVIFLTKSIYIFMLSWP